MNDIVKFVNEDGENITMIRFGGKVRNGLPVCRCGEEVCSPHQECLSLMSPLERYYYLGLDEGLENSF